MTTTEHIKRQALALGFQAVGIARVDRREEALEGRLRSWLARGYHGLMAWMERDPDRRADPARILPGCRSVISLGMNYFTDHQPDERPGYGRIARYAWGEDYHHILRDRLERLVDEIHALAPESQSRCYVDTGPVMEKAWAERAGLGWIGKHSNLVSPQYGSWLLLGEILTTLELPPDEAGTDLCGSCTLCLRACPTGAIVEPYVVDARKCISYLTIELRGDEHAIPDSLGTRMGNRIFGCDDCLDVCPYNVNATETRETAFQPTARTLAPDLHALSTMTEQEFSVTFRRSPLRRPKYRGLLRNVGLALGNLARIASFHS